MKKITLLSAVVVFATVLALLKMRRRPKSDTDAQTARRGR